MIVLGQVPPQPKPSADHRRPTTYMGVRVALLEPNGPYKIMEVAALGCTCGGGV